MPPAGLAPGWSQGWPRRLWVTKCRGYPVASAPRHSRAGVGVKVVQRMRCSTLTPTPALLRDNPADATGYPLPPLLPVAGLHNRRDRHSPGCQNGQCG
jgi:hypothetical protein